MKSLKISIIIIFSFVSITTNAQWLTNSVGTYYNQAGKSVTVGSTGAANSKFNVISDLGTSIFSSNIGISANEKYGIFSQVAGSGANSYGIYSTVSSNSGEKYGIYSTVTGIGNKYSIYSECALGNPGNSWAGYFKNGMIELANGDFIIGNSTMKWNQRVYYDANTKLNVLVFSPSLSPINYTWNNLKSIIYTENGDALFSGKVGIGNLNNFPTRELDVTGDIALSGAIYGKPSLHAWNKLELFGSSNENAAKIEIGDGTANWNCIKFIAPGENAYFQFYQDKTIAMEIKSGKIFIGNQSKQFDLNVDGKVLAREVKVTLDNWYDHVFALDYKLMPLEELSVFVKQNNHLPDMPTESEVLKNGVNVGEMNALLLKKVEELTLYVIEQQKQNIEQQKQINELKATLSK